MSEIDFFNPSTYATLGSPTSTTRPAGKAATGMGSSFFGDMSGKDWIGLGANVAGTAINAIGQNQARGDAREDASANRALTTEQFNANLKQRQAETGLEATQYDPFTQLAARQGQALKGLLHQNFTPVTYTDGKITGGYNSITPEMMATIKEFYGPNAMAASESAFTKTAKAASPTYQGGDPSKLGYTGSALDTYNSGMGGAWQSPTMSPSSGGSGMSALARSLAGGGNSGGDGGGSGMGSLIGGLAAGAAPSILGKILGGGGASAAGTGANIASNAGGLMSTANSFAGPAAMVGKAKGALQGASTGAQIGSFVPGVGTAIGAGVGALAGAVNAHQNKTIGDRKQYATDNGFADLHALNEYLSTRGADGQEIREYGESKVGKHDPRGNAAWLQAVQELMSQRSA
jgi:hypothetical protein